MTDVMTDREQIMFFERQAEEAYSRMYDATSRFCRRASEATSRRTTPAPPITHSNATMTISSFVPAAHRLN